jgi:hypothetical protein
MSRKKQDRHSEPPALQAGIMMQPAGGNDETVHEKN